MFTAPSAYDQHFHAATFMVTVCPAWVTSLLGNLGVVKDFLRVVQVFQYIQQFLHLLGIVTCQLNGVVGAHGDFGQLGLEAGRLQRIFDSFKTGVGRQHFYGAVVIGDHVVGAGLQRHFHDLVFIGAGRKNQLPTVFELKRHGAFRTHVAAVLGKGVANFSHRAHLVVGHAVHQDGGAAKTVAFVADFLVVNAFQAACGLVDIALDGVGWHVGRLGLVHGQAQARVGGQVTSTQAGSHHDFADDPRPDLAAFVVLATLAVLNIRPFAMTSHDRTPCLTD